MSSARFVIEPSSALIDEHVNIRLLNLSPDAKVIVRASAIEATGQEWYSEATFVAGPEGEIDTALQTPISGTYDFTDSMGLLNHGDLGLRFYYTHIGYDPLGTDDFSASDQGSVYPIPHGHGKYGVVAQGQVLYTSAARNLVKDFFEG